jgi:hypothetical protein
MLSPIRSSALLLLLASCGGAPVANTALPAPEPSSAVVLLDLGPNTFPFFTSNTTVTTQGNLIISQYEPGFGIRADAPTGLFDISSPSKGGFRAVKVPPGTYAVRNVWLFPLWSMCLNKGSVAFEAKAGTITYLGHLDTMAYVTRLRDFALAHPPQYDHPHLSQNIRQIDSTSFMPAAADLADATAFASAQLGRPVAVEAANFVPANWPTEDNWAGVDICGIKSPK